MEDLVVVTVNVPREWLGDFHQMYGQWLASKVGGLPASSSDVDANDDWLPFDQGPEAKRFRDAENMYSQVSSRARALLDHWIDHPGMKESADDLARAIGAAGGGSIPGILASMGARRKPMKRPVPFQWRDGVGGGVFWMRPEVAAVFGAARAALRSGERPVSSPED